MTDTRMRFVEFERGQIDMETGEFPMILASDGEASDGHVLSIEGAQFTSRAPLLISHNNDPREQLGTVSGFRRELTGSPKRLKARGQIDLTGEGPVADVRRDLAHMIHEGHLTGISVRWNPIKATRRMDLPPEHYAHVKANEPSWSKRNGMYFERWEVLEGSIVAIPADKAAMVGRAEQTEGAVAEFWTRMVAEATEPEPQQEVEVHEPTPEPVRVEEPPPVPVDAKLELPDLLRTFAQTVNALEGEGLTIDDISNALDEMRAPTVPTAEEMAAQISSLRAELEALKHGRENGSPSEPKAVAQMLRDLMAESEQRHQQNVSDLRAYIDSRRGAVPDEAMREAIARIRARLTQA